MARIGREQLRALSLDIDSLVDALAFYPESDALHDYVFEKVTAESPGQLVELISKLASHTDYNLRLTAALWIDDLYASSPDQTIDLWRQLLQDEEPMVAQRAMEALEGMGERDDLSMDTVVTLGILGTEMAVLRQQLVS